MTAAVADPSNLNWLAPAEGIGAGFLPSASLARVRALRSRRGVEAEGEQMIMEIHVSPNFPGDASQYQHVEAAIAEIQSSGLNHEVGALGTTLSELVAPFR